MQRTTEAPFGNLELDGGCPTFIKVRKISDKADMRALSIRQPYGQVGEKSVSNAEIFCLIAQECLATRFLWPMSFPNRVPPPDAPRRRFYALDCHAHSP